MARSGGKWIRIQRTTAPADFECFLINNLTDADWYYVETGEVVAELLSYEGYRT